MLVGDGVDEWYTVVAICLETMERWAESFNVDTALLAEEKAQEYARDRGIHFAVAAVIRGKIWDDVDLADGYAKWVDPLAKSQEEMNTIMSDLGLWKLGEWYNDKPKDETKWWKK